MKCLLAILMLVQPPSEVDLAAARIRAKQAMVALQQQSQLDAEIVEAFEEVKPVEPPVVDPPVKSVQVEWSAPAKGDVYEEQDVLYLVTQDGCPPCITMKRDLQRRGIPFEEIHYTTARAMGYTVKGTPMQINAKKRVKVSSGPAAVTATVDSDTVPLVLPLLAEHLASQSNEAPPVKGLLDIDVDTPAYLPGLINDLLIGQRYENESLGLTAEWSGSRTIKVDAGRLTISPPVKITKKVAIVSVRCTLEAVVVSQGGQRIDLELGGSPDLTIMLKGYQATAEQPQTFFYREASYSRWKGDGGATEWTHESLLSHLRNGSHHKGKSWQSWPLEMLTFGQLRAIHDDDHEGKI